ncbi:hypothetical protein AJ80_01854 [Polytolypa hystricis UAMH7299]|uniref:Uncharacterized protein n=1 Tax=Polytolypa hystricis (strain UAMH7299) TaxID=1447883 RepID=A0A2B7YZF9_POLH7|nr:hypothetical protein AJ80_01854 [Polytolypa hystricis UAMH7299]
MDFTTETHDRDAYHLLKRFTFPTENDGNKDAVAVTSSAGDSIISAYALILEITFFQLWMIVLISGVLVSYYLKDESSVHNNGLLRIIWRAQDPLDVGKLLIKWLWACFQQSANRAETRKQKAILALWILLGLGFAALLKAMPIIIPPQLSIGNGAPPVADKIYVPSQGTRDNIQSLLDVRNIEVLSALRAMGSFQVADSETLDQVYVSDEILISDPPDGNRVIRVDYGYKVTGLEFGLQNYRDLTLNVNGSCLTEYSWFVETDNQQLNSYRLWDSETLTNISRFDGMLPLATSHLGPREGPGSNQSYALLVSAIGRASYTLGNDPIYLTTEENDAATGLFTVIEARPVLRCWQSDIWSFEGQNNTLEKLRDIPGLEEFPNGLEIIFSRFLSVPKIYYLVQQLGFGALKASATAYDEIFDANSSTTRIELERLIAASFIATANIFQASTLVPEDERRGVPNLISNIKDSATGFVIKNSDVTTLSVRVLIIIPTITAAMYLLVYVLLWLTKRLTEPLEDEVLTNIPPPSTTAQLQPQPRTRAAA